jgi:ubiquinone biosynthesis protein UbiJ
MPPFPSFLHPATLALRAFNALLRREDWARYRLSPHAGKSLRFTLSAWSFDVTISSDGELRLSDPAVVPDVSISLPQGRHTELWTLWREGRLRDVSSILHLEGDAGLVQVVAELARDLRWDIEDELSHIVGDIAALRVLGSMRALSEGVRGAARHGRENIAEYLGEESGLLVQRREFTAWQTQVEGLSARLDGLDRRLARQALRMGRPC